MIERTFLFGRNSNLVGTLCFPDPGLDSRSPVDTGVILFNAGIVHRIGPHRINVKIARRLASVGVASLRFDLSGLGDSAAAADLPFEQQAVVDLHDAVSTLGAAANVKRFGVFGFCSGAFHSMNAAISDQRINALLLFEAYRYGTVQSRMRRRFQRVQHLGFLSTVRGVAARFLKRTGGRTAGGSVKVPNRIAGSGYIADSTSSKSRFAHDAAVLLKRRVTIAMIFAGDGLEIYNYAGQFADAFRRYSIAPRIPVTFLRDIDHVATAVGSQAALMQAVVNWAVASATAFSDVQTCSTSPANGGSAVLPHSA